MTKYLGKHMESALHHDLSTGQATIYTTPSPKKNFDANEDACALIPIAKGTDLLVLADGVGGHRGGQDASKSVIESMCDVVSSDNIDATNLREPILNTIETCNETLLHKGLGSASTLVITEIQNRQVRPYYIGDSTIIITSQRGNIKFQSIAQSPVGYALESGLIEKEDEQINENSHYVSNIIGMSEMHMTVGPWLNLAKRDTLLLCSDGLTDNLSIEEVVNTIRIGSLHDASQKLIFECHSAMEGEEGHADDLSFILFRTTI